LLFSGIQESILILLEKLLKKARKSKGRLGPQEIRLKEFNKKRFGFGYDPEEVKVFLIEVADAYQDLLKELMDLERKSVENNLDTQELMDGTLKGIEEILQRKTEVEEEIERQKQEIAAEIEKLKLIRKKLFERIKFVIFDMVGVIEKLKPDTSIEKH
jgi:DivIVA domain-containing protein